MTFVVSLEQLTPTNEPCRTQLKTSKNPLWFKKTTPKSFWIYHMLFNNSFVVYKQLDLRFLDFLLLSIRSIASNLFLFVLKPLELTFLDFSLFSSYLQVSSYVVLPNYIFLLLCCTIFIFQIHTSIIVCIFQLDVFHLLLDSYYQPILCFIQQSRSNYHLMKMISFNWTSIW